MAVTVNRSKGGTSVFVEVEAASGYAAKAEGHRVAALVLDEMGARSCLPTIETSTVSGRVTVAELWPFAEPYVAEASRRGGAWVARVVVELAGGRVRTDAGWVPVVEWAEAFVDKALRSTWVVNGAGDRVRCTVPA